MSATLQQARLKLCQPVWKKLKFKSNEMLQAEWKYAGWHVKASVGTVRDGMYLDELNDSPVRLPEGCSYHGTAYDQGTGSIIVPGALFQCQEKAKEYLEESVVAWLASRPKRQADGIFKDNAGTEAAGCLAQEAWQPMQTVRKIKI